MITKILNFPNGALACFDANGQQVPEWQSNLLLDKLAQMREAGVIQDSTKVMLGNGLETTVVELLGPTA